jgi:hypothetical protein
MARPLSAAGLAIALALAACSSDDPPSASASIAGSATPPPPAIKTRMPPRSRIGAAHVEASSLPVPEDFESELRKQITSSNYLDALESAAAEASAAARAHP